jgi:hypothetical protein
MEKRIGTQERLDALANSMHEQCENEALNAKLISREGDWQGGARVIKLGCGRALGQVCALGQLVPGEGRGRMRPERT